MKKQTIKLLLLVLIAVTALTAMTLFSPSYAENAKADYDFSGIYLTRDSVKLKVGGSYTLSTRAIKADDGEKVFSSSDTAVATVDESGVVTAVSIGETQVTVKKGKYSDTVKIIVTENDPAHEDYAHTAELYRDFLDLRFGMFLHFNSSTYEFAEIGGDWAGENRTSTFDPKSWNPTDIDCNEWAKVAKSAGMTFAVLTTKHHDGFDLWDSAYTDYDVGAATDTRDVVKAFTDACREEGIKPGLYFSMLDIKHKITSSSCTPSDIEFIKAQLTELMTNYGEIPFIIIDAWNAWWGGPNYTILPYDEIVNLIHTLQPNCLVINISCEANNVKSEVAMFESAAGQQVPDWFDNVNISCNTPTSHWFWCTKYQNETFKTADWVFNENLHPFRDSDTVFILNCSPNQKGVLINKYKTLFAEIGKRYQKEEDVAVYPKHYLADYRYTDNLLFHKRTWSSATDGNASPERAVDGYCDLSASHETSYRSKSTLAAWVSDIGYTAPLDKCFIHLSSDMTEAALQNAYLYVLSEDPGRIVNFNKIDKMTAVKKVKLSDCERLENCLSVELSGLNGRYLAIALEKAGVLGLSEVVLVGKAAADDSAYSLREKFAVRTHTLGTSPNLPEEGLFISENGALLKEAIIWKKASPDTVGEWTLTGKSESGCEVAITLSVVAAGSYIEIPSKSVTASSMWGQAEDLGWAHSRNLIDKSGLTVNPVNILYSTHDNPYNATTMWHTLDGERTGWLIFDLGEIKTVTNILIWNHNQLNETNRGVKRMALYYTDKENPAATDWLFAGNYQLTKAGGGATQAATDFLSIGTLSARKIKLDLLGNYGNASLIGLSEVMFFAERYPTALDMMAANKALSDFEIANWFDYTESAYSAAKEAYQALLSCKNNPTSQETLDSLTAALNEKLTAMKATYKKKTPKNLGAYSFTLQAGEPLPDTLTVTFTDNSKSELAVLWDHLPAGKDATIGCFSLKGLLVDSAYAVTATVKIEGVSKASLETIVSDYRILSLNDYTELSKTAFVTAFKKAEAVLARATATQEEIDAAKAELTAAKYRLVRSYDKTLPTPPDSTTGNAVTTTTPTPVTTAPTPVTTEVPTTTVEAVTTTAPTPVTTAPSVPSTTEVPTTTVDAVTTTAPTLSDGNGGDGSGGSEKDDNSGVVIAIVITVAVIFGVGGGAFYGMAFYLIKKKGA